MKDKIEINKLATDHWIYSKNIIVKASHRNWNESDLELMAYLYVEAFKHGYKHAEDDRLKENKKDVE